MKETNASEEFTDQTWSIERPDETGNEKLQLTGIQISINNNVIRVKI